MMSSAFYCEDQIGIEPNMEQGAGCLDIGFSHRFSALNSVCVTGYMCRVAEEGE